MTEALGHSSMPIDGLLERCENAIRILAEARPLLANLVAEAHRSEDPRLNEYLKFAHDAGFTLQELGGMVGLTRERVRQRILAGIPEPVERFEISSEDAIALRHAHSLADGRVPSKRQETARYRAMLAEQRSLGANPDQLAATLGVTRHAIEVQLKLHARDASASDWDGVIEP